jgi:hypothetical protein
LRFRWLRRLHRLAKTAMSYKPKTSNNYKPKTATEQTQPTAIKPNNKPKPVTAPAPAMEHNNKPKTNYAKAQKQAVAQATPLVSNSSTATAARTDKDKTHKPPTHNPTLLPFFQLRVDGL